MGKNVLRAVGPVKQPSETEVAAQQETKKSKAIMLIVNTLGDTPLRAVMAEAECSRKV